MSGARRAGVPIDLSGRVAVVTGGTRGVGRAAALLLAEAGADVVLGYRSREADARATVEAVERLGGRAVAVAGDLALERDAEALFEACDEAFGRLDFFVGNAGVWPPDPVALADMATEQWRRTMAVNLDGVFFTTRAAARRIREGGAIVLVTSTAAQRGEAYHGDYAASKGAIQSLVKGLCVELGPRDVTVNAVAPGWIDTEMSASVLRDEAALAEIRAGIPLGRVASAEDIAGPILFLCSRFARDITGEILNVNGGAVLAG
ncbi:MAG: SDR family oxidoreductase [Gemmatimonadetes bacterium]|nr:MAG: SDR family oxidoreductase [Gemmatimonadota bacterium]